MKKSHLFHLSLVLVLSLVSLPAQAAKYSLTYATHAIENSFRGQAELAFLNEIERLSNNEVEFKIFWGSSLMSGAEILNGVSSGIIDSGLVNINYHPKELLINNSINTIQEPIGNYAHLLEFFTKVYDEIPLLKEEFRSFNTEPLYIYGVMPMTFVSTQKMTTLADLSGQKARAASRWLLPLIQELKAQPVSIPWDDCNMSLQTKVIHTVFSNYDSINMVKMDEVAPNILIFDDFFPTSSYLITVNKQKFESFPPELQAIFHEASKNATQSLPALYERDYQNILNAQKEANYTVTHISAEDAAAWLELKGIENNKAQWIQEAQNLNVENAQALLATIYKIFHEVQEQ